MNTTGRRTMAGLVIVLLLIGGGGCSHGQDSKEAPAPSDGPHVVASLFPLQWVAGEVLDGRGEVTALAGAGAEPHELELSPAQVATLGRADVAVVVTGFQPALDKALAQSAPRRIVDFAEVEATRRSSQTPTEGATAEGAATPPAEGATARNDPHLWLDPTRLSLLADELAFAFGEVDPDNAEHYREAALRVDLSLSALDGQFMSMLGACERRVFVPDHAAYGYLAERYGLTQLAIGGIDPESEPSPTRLGQIADEAREAGVTTVFYETGGSDQTARALAELAGDLAVGALDPLERDDGEGYIARMQANAVTLASAGGCL